MSTARSVGELVAELESGHSPDYVYFWGHRQRSPDTPDPSCLSQWFPAPFTLDGVAYRTAEHFMMAEKARLFDDERSRLKAISAESPGAAKAAGREVTGFDQAKWDDVKSALVIQANLGKFAANPRLRDYLLGTRQRVLVEASPIDPVWGIGMDLNEAMVTHPSQWRGENLLGFALMEVRDRLQDAGAGPTGTG